ncbi:MAG: methylmalonyl Co-A mutase-associated GTPase MeaB, partial [Anaerolineae bacterium]
MTGPSPAADEALVSAVRRGERRAVARALSRVENEAECPLADALYPFTGRAHVVGVTGAPGSGKSTLVSALTQVYRRAGRRVGILAVDPSSPFTGGAVLGDRVRMGAHSGDEGVFIRSMASRGRVGGLARATGDAVRVLDAAGFDVVVVETVGAGQAEVGIADEAHTTVVVAVPGLGDDIQAIKAGILEIADVFCVNKADLPGADRTVAQLKMNLSIG